MKLPRILTLVLTLLTGWTSVRGQDITPEVPGDHFSLEGALELFKRSESPEEFERLLNEPDSKVNNLDLDGDGYIDYVRVIDRNEGNVHAFILQAVISGDDYQDVAVIELEKLANGKAVLQIIGDEDVYGVETIIEPTREVRTYAGATSTRTVVNVWAWPSVRYVYGPHYTVWVSPWRWHRRPVWWRPWRPVTYVYYYDYWRPYRPYYSACHTHRVVYAREIYRPYRTTSLVVRDRHHAQLDRYRSSHRDSYRTLDRRDDGRRGYSGREPESDLTRRRTAVQTAGDRSSREMGRNREEVLRGEAARRESTNLNRPAAGTQRYSAGRSAGFQGRVSDSEALQTGPERKVTPPPSEVPQVQRPATRQRSLPQQVRRDGPGRDDYSVRRAPVNERPPSMRRETGSRSHSIPAGRQRTGAPEPVRPRPVTRPADGGRQVSPGATRTRSAQVPNYQRQSSRTEMLRRGGRGRD